MLERLRLHLLPVLVEPLGVGDVGVALGGAGGVGVVQQLLASGVVGGGRGDAGRGQGVDWMKATRESTKQPECESAHSTVL